MEKTAWLRARSSIGYPRFSFCFKRRCTSSMIIPLVCSTVWPELLITFAPRATMRGAEARWLSRWSRIARFSSSAFGRTPFRSFMNAGIEIKFKIRFGKNIRADIASFHHQIAKLNAFALLEFHPFADFGKGGDVRGGGGHFRRCGFPCQDNSHRPANALCPRHIPGRFSISGKGRPRPCGSSISTFFCKQYQARVRYIAPVST